jgi:coenzyme F420-reducing hydrogenase beta subunit
MQEQYYLASARNEQIRYKASSGGVGTAIIKYLLSLEEYGTCLTFSFNQERCAYELRLVYSFEDYNICGSIYQDVDVYQFIKENIASIRGGIIVTCMPCQVRAIRAYLGKNHIVNFIISFCCSGQTTIEGTWQYYKMLGINKQDVIGMQYRGNGWPSGIQIHLKDGTTIKKDNWTYPWTIIHSSLLYRPKRCLSCPVKTVPYSDVNLADPWLKECEYDSVGQSIVIANSELGKYVMSLMISHNLVLSKKINEDVYIRSQKGTIIEKQSHKNRKKFNSIILFLSKSFFYMYLVSHFSFFMSFHCRYVLKIIKKYENIRQTKI